ncbi:MAG: hypothetical protein IJD04_01405 [Desulfovibrionaceae bacterium]|nr:hypothetical protein [Desulfovibrionaceae bacterium]
MGRVLQIRVSAQTVSPSEVGWSWRRLCLLAFGKQPSNDDKNMGVFELVDALVDKFRFGDMEQQLKEKLHPGLEKAMAIRRQIEEALADWNPGRANMLSNDLEDALDALENITPDPKLKQQ